MTKRVPALPLLMLVSTLLACADADPAPGPAMSAAGTAGVGAGGGSGASHGGGASAAGAAGAQVMGGSSGGGAAGASGSTSDGGVGGVGGTMQGGSAASGAGGDPGSAGVSGVGGADGGQGGGGSAGSAGAPAMAPPALPIAGEYELTPQNTASGGSATPLHLSVARAGNDVTVMLSVPFGGIRSNVATFDPNRAFAPPSFNLGAMGTVTGPLMVSTAVAVDRGTIGEMAFSIDGEGRPIAATAGGSPWTMPPCHSTYGARFGIVYGVTADLIPPAVQAPTSLLPWQARLDLSERVSFTPPAVGNATLSSLELEGLALVPRFSGKRFALLGETVTFSFAALADGAGNVAPAEVALTFADLGSPIGTTDFRTPGASAGMELGLLARRSLRLQKGGATKAKLWVRRIPSAEGWPGTLLATAWPDVGVETTGSVTVGPGEAESSTLSIALPADDVVLELSAGPCAGFYVEQIELL